MMLEKYFRRLNKKISTSCKADSFSLWNFVKLKRKFTIDKDCLARSDVRDYSGLTITQTVARTEVADDSLVAHRHLPVRVYKSWRSVSIVDRVYVFTLLVAILVKPVLNGLKASYVPGFLIMFSLLIFFLTSHGTGSGVLPGQ